ncbi:MAG: dihydrodipicolinate synthase family protein [Chloroflexota bacterium]
MTLNLNGIFPACVTPFDADGDVAPQKFAANVARWEQAGLHGYLVLGSTGEFAYLDESERARVLEAARQAIPSHKTMMVGAGAESTRTTIKYVKQAASHGADCVLVVTPVYYTRGKEDAQRKFFLDVAEASPIPVLIYNVPPFTAYNLTAEFVAKLSTHPNIVGIKDSSGDVGQLADTVRLSKKGFAAFTGGARVVYPCLAIGACGAVLAAANPLGYFFVQIYEAFKRGDYALAQKLQRDIRDAEHKISAFGIAGQKAAMDALGWDGGAPRLPMLPLDDTAKAKVRETMQTMMALA